MTKLDWFANILRIRFTDQLSKSWDELGEDTKANWRLHARGVQRSLSAIGNTLDGEVNDA